MDNQRLLVWATFGLMAWLCWQAWVTDYGPKPQPATKVTESAPASDAADDTLPELGDTLEDAAAADVDAPALDTAAPETVAPAVARAQTVSVTTDVLNVEISTRGATLVLAELRRYPVDKKNPDNLVRLLGRSADDLGLLQTGLRAAGDGDEPNHQAMFEPAADSYTLTGDTLVVPFTWTGDTGVRVEKQFIFRRGSYQVDVTQRVINRSGEPWRGAAYAQLQRRSRPVDRSMFDVDSYSFDGPIIYDGQKSSKLQRDDLMADGPLSQVAIGGWVATIEHHFLSAIVPPSDQEYRYRVAVRNNLVVASSIGPAQRIAPDATGQFETTLFVGPKLQRQLEDIDESLKLTVDYGWLTIISQPLFWLLSKVHALVENWGLAIIIVTILIKLAFYKLTEASGRSMAKMRKIQPRMKALQERYKDDRQALSQAMMELYKREKVNPAAGCLPILIQMPFFLAFYWVLLESVEMRQAPFALWITDLSSRDPYFILPVIMGAAMLFQQKLNPAPADPIQARVMQIMPIVFTAFFAFFPSGLVLYWVTNTLLSIAQQWKINRVVEAEDKRKAGGKKARKRERGDDDEA